VTLAVAMVVRWGGLAALAGVIGSCAVERLITPVADADTRPMHERLRGWSLACVGILVVTTLAELVLRAGTLASGGPGRAVAALPLVLSRTHFGAVWLGRMAALIALALVMVSRRRRRRSAALALAAGVALSTALLGHAADGGDLTLSVALDWLHIVAASLWIGGLAVLAAIVAPAGAAVGIPCVARFSRVAAWTLAAVVLTGAWNTWAQVREPAALIASSYGRTLLAKIALVGVLVVLGATSRYALLPRLTGLPARGVAARAFRRGRLALFGPAKPSLGRLVALITGEAGIGLAVLALTAVLGESTPARHAAHITHVGDADGPATPHRATMEELHAAGGVPKGWTFRLPAGDPDRGRQVFSRLECFRCHRVRGESFPRPSAAGPDLTDVGLHHPGAYIAESVVNPDAVIVEGPGYTAPDGRSTMPEYREAMTVAELVDLVAFLSQQRAR
jgi:putative copper export protein/mono/diheme cytochrome c family protein